MHEYDVALKNILTRPGSALLVRLTGGSSLNWLNVEAPKVNNRRVDLPGELPDGNVVHIELQGSLPIRSATPYRKRKSGKLYYHHPAFLPTTMLEGSTRQLLQVYFDRWQIEVLTTSADKGVALSGDKAWPLRLRWASDEKDTLGVGQAQLWNPASVPKQPALVAASYPALLLAALKAFGPGRGEAYAALPKWRKQAKRPSCLDLAILMRKEAQQNPTLLETFGFRVSSDQMIADAARMSPRHAFTVSRRSMRRASIA